ncbi:MAG: dihydropteroate synthase [Paludibacteraceae bacterium]|nr:dihydropteroate synthase [Paludibacteraceae bacterium]
MQQSIKVHSRLLDLSSPKVMAIVNVTPDSFYTSWGGFDMDTLLHNIQTMMEQGADIIDVGACSTRPNSTPVNAEEEWKRLASVLQLIRTHFPNVILSVDTFRAGIADRAIEAGADIINDVCGGNDEEMWKVIARHNVPYILTYAQEIQSQGEVKDYDYTMSHVLDYFQSRLDALHRMGVADVVVDPGFGFGKTVEQNYRILDQLDILSVLHAPILVGISRKSMLYKPLCSTPEEVLPATVAANMLALERGAHILRVHDVEAAKQAITIYTLAHKIK